MADRITKESLVKAIAEKVKLTRVNAKKTVDTLLETIQGALKKKLKVAIPGFGTFYVTKRSSRKGVNPKTKEKITIPGGYVPRFKAGKALKKLVKG